MTSPNDQLWPRIEDLLQNDPAGRGVASLRIGGRGLFSGHLAAASRGLAEDARSVGIVTGFAVFDGQRWIAETDGPPGALYLARGLLELGIDVTIISDRCCLPLLEAGCDLWHLPRDLLVQVPLAPEVGWEDSFLASDRGQRMTHLVSIERVGPSHTEASLTAQLRESPAALTRFRNEVPEASRDVCHNMRGEPIDAHTAPLHRLFEVAQSPRHGTSQSLTTIGIGDGGNEIGLGSAPWELLRDAMGGSAAGRIVCRIPTDYTLVAGVSNWAAYALTAGVCHLRNRRQLLATWNADDQQRLLDMLVYQADAVDGLTRRHEPTVDGLSRAAYFAPLNGMLEAAGAASQ